MSRRAVAVFGGTFNPVHYGHLRSARELVDTLPIEQLRFVPARQPPHREAPAVSAEDRAAMVELAIADEPGMICDRRELQRAGPSYSVDTLSSLRRELGEARPLAMIVGRDAVLGLKSWHRWPQLFDLAHLIVIARPGWDAVDRDGIAELLAGRAITVPELTARAAGGVLERTLAPQEISSTEVRALLQSGKSAADWVPGCVIDYIEAHGLYRAADPDSERTEKGYHRK
jgi:nicotinate-nucleotide adenylyltransferase